MIVYHGSSHSFRTLRIRPELTGESARNNEGCGIYFSKQKSIAKSYGEYLYTIEITEKIPDFRGYKECAKYMHKMCKEIGDKTGINPAHYLNPNKIASYLNDGRTAISGAARELWMCLDSLELFHLSVPESKKLQIYQILKRYDKDHLQAYLFPYNIKDCGVIKKVNQDTMKIIAKERIR